MDMSAAPNCKAFGLAGTCAETLPETPNQFGRTMHDPFRNQIYPLELSGPQPIVDWRFVDPGLVEWKDGDRNLGVMNLEHPENPVPVPNGIPNGIRLASIEGRLQGPLFDLDQPWEQNYNMYFATAMKHGGLYKIWYTCIPPDNRDSKWERGQIVCYAESRDGVHWQKPQLGLYEFEGIKTNAVFGRTLAPYGFQSGSIFVDPSADPDQRFKMIYVGNVPVDDMAAYRNRLSERFGDQIDPRALQQSAPNHFEKDVEIADFRKDAKIMFGATSPDGIHWTSNPEPIAPLFSDTLNSASWDCVRNRYVAYVRTWRYGRRCVGRMTTTDFWHWPRLPETVLEAPLDWHPADDIYTNSKTCLPGTSGIHVMFPGTFRRHTNSRDISFASSIDDLTWQWVSDKAIVRRGAPETWAAGDLNPGIGMVSLPDGQWALPVMVYDRPHKYPRTGEAPLGRPSWAVWERSRIACIEAEGLGAFTTPCLVFNGCDLVLNHCTDPTGEILVQVVDAQGRLIPGLTFEDCTPCRGNRFEEKVTWVGSASLAKASGQKVKFMFRLRASKLFALEVTGGTS